MATISKYNKFLLTQMNGGTDTTGGSTSSAARVVDFDTDTIKVMLTSSTYAPSATTQATKTSVTNEVTGTGYTAGGATLTSPVVSESAGTVSFAAADVTWAANAAGFSNARYAVIYKDTGTAGTSTLIGWIDLGSNKGNVDGDLTLDFASTIFNWA